MPSGDVLDLSNGASTYDAAAKIGAGLARAAVAGKICDGDGTHVCDLHRPLPGDCTLSVLTQSDDDADARARLRV